MKLPFFSGGLASSSFKAAFDAGGGTMLVARAADGERMPDDGRVRVAPSSLFPRPPTRP